MSAKAKFLAALALLGALVVPAAVPAGPELSTYRVTISNLTESQPFSPPVASTHQKAIRMFQVGRLASQELESIAEDGDEVPMFMRLSASDKVTQAVDVGRPLTRMGTTFGSFTDSATFEISAAPGDKFSIATMLICTNDGFLGLDAVKLPRDGSLTYRLAGYDSGTEQNTEQSVDLVDPCSALGPMPLPGDPDGNRNNDVATVPPDVIAHHPGIAGVGELSADAHGWTNPVAEVLIERIG